MTDRPDSPNVELLRQTGWSIGALSGNYCVAWHGDDEVVLVWRDGEWKVVSSRGALRAAA